MSTPEIRTYQLGEPIPGDVGPHAVSASLPSVADVVGFSSGDPTVTGRMEGIGYPRFCVNQLTQLALKDFRTADPRLQSGERQVIALGSQATAEDIVGRFPLRDAEIDATNPLTFLSFRRSPLNYDQAVAYTKLAGVPPSSRRAESHLITTNNKFEPFREQRAYENAAGTVIDYLEGHYPYRGAKALLTTSGMNAIFSVFEAFEGIHVDDERHMWVQFGNLYSDVSDMLAEYGEDTTQIHDITNFDDLRELLAAQGRSVGAIFTEVPSNPLIETPDLERLKALADEYGIPIVIDVSMAGSTVVDVHKYADVVTESLTKFASGHGDLMMGAIILNRDSPFYDQLLPGCLSSLEAPFHSDTARLAHEIQDYTARAYHIGQNARTIVEYLEAHDGIEELYWTGAGDNRHRFNNAAHRSHATGGVISFVPRKELSAVYDQLALPKGFSFGMEQTLVTLYNYITHYDEVSSPDGIKRLLMRGLHPHLMRLSVGLENPEDVIARLNAVL